MGAWRQVKGDRVKIVLFVLLFHPYRVPVIEGAGKKDIFPWLGLDAEFHIFLFVRI